MGSPILGWGAPSPRRSPFERAAGEKTMARNAILLNFEWFLSGGPMGRRVQYCAKSTPYIAPQAPYPTLLLQDCYQVLERCEKRSFSSFYSLFNDPTILRIVPSAGVHVIDSTIPRCCGVGVRVSAPLRRGAAPYADGCDFRAFTPHFLVHFRSTRGVQPGILHRILSTARYHQKSLLVPLPTPTTPKCPIQKDLAPTDPSPGTPRYTTPRGRSSPVAPRASRCHPAMRQAP